MRKVFLASIIAASLCLPMGLLAQPAPGNCSQQGVTNAGVVEFQQAGCFHWKVPDDVKYVFVRGCGGGSAGGDGTLAGGGAGGSGAQIKQLLLGPFPSGTSDIRVVVGTGGASSGKAGADTEVFATPLGSDKAVRIAYFPGGASPAAAGNGSAGQPGAPSQTDFATSGAEGPTIHTCGKGTAFNGNHFHLYGGGGGGAGMGPGGSGGTGDRGNLSAINGAAGGECAGGGGGRTGAQEGSGCEGTPAGTGGPGGHGRLTLAPFRSDDAAQKKLEEVVKMLNDLQKDGH